MGQKTGKTGPDPLPRSRKRSRCVLVKLTPSEHALLKRQAKAAGLPLAPFLVKCWKG